MEQYYSVLRQCPLFDRISDSEMRKLLPCLGAQISAVPRHRVIFREGEPAEYMGLVLSGTVQVIRVDYYGNRSIVAKIGPPEMFGESFACAGVESMPISVIATEDSIVMKINCRRITDFCENTCVFHKQIIYNLLRVVADKNILINQKVEIISKRTTREKLMTYLLIRSRLQNSNSFTIPFDRQALADYLEVDRSAMSAVISELRNQGVIECHKNAFKLL